MQICIAYPIKCGEETVPNATKTYDTNVSEQLTSIIQRPTVQTKKTNLDMKNLIG